VHPSNFIQKGFVESPSIRELATVARNHRVLLIADNGSGPLIDTAQFGLRHEPMPAEAVSAGADVVTFSTDKLLGGPQAGVIAGKADVLKRISHHQQSRAIRPDKLIVAALAATLSQYARNDFESIPIVRMLSTAEEEIENRANGLLDAIGSTVTGVTVTATRSTLGGGALPEETLPSYALTLDARNVDAVARWLRTQLTPVLGRTTKGRLMLDLRTVDPHDDQILLDTLLKLPSVSW
jgi:L-seryl-tRNA(Ser) seleniumtransferase